MRELPPDGEPRMSTPDPLQRMIDKLRIRARLEPADCDAMRAWPVRRRSYEPPAYIVREGASPIQFCSFVVSGFALRQKLAANGGRQIVSVQVPGDFLDLQHLFLKRADHNVQALTRLETIDIDREALQALALRHPAIGRALWVDALCEFTVRMHASQLIQDGEMCELPMTQEQLGDATGLTSVHVNRTLKGLEA